MSEQEMNNRSKVESIQSVLTDHEDKTKKLIARVTAELSKDESLDTIFEKLEQRGIVFSSMEKNKVVEAQSVNSPDKQNQLAQNHEQTQRPTVQEQDEGR